MLLKEDEPLSHGDTERKNTIKYLSVSPCLSGLLSCLFSLNALAYFSSNIPSGPSKSPHTILTIISAESAILSTGDLVTIHEDSPKVTEEIGRIDEIRRTTHRRILCGDLLKQTDHASASFKLSAIVAKDSATKDPSDRAAKSAQDIITSKFIG
jgi:hypothetical protein